MPTAEAVSLERVDVMEPLAAPRIPWRLAVVSHKLCWPSAESRTGYATDGGFPMQMKAIAELFPSTRLVVPIAAQAPRATGLRALEGPGMSVRPLSLPRGLGLRRKLDLPRWLASNGGIILEEVRAADAVHVPIPGDVGTFGMLMAHALGKPLFVRHCGNWFVQTTAAERFWRWYMERFAGGRRVMLATGGAAAPPSARNPAVRWIFSTSLASEDLALRAKPRSHPNGRAPRLLIACRQDEEKGTGVVLQALPAIRDQLPGATLEVLGDGPAAARFQAVAAELGVAESVAFRGRVDHAEVLDAMARADVFLYPTAASEGFPKVVLEALASGLPVISTAVSVIPVLLAEGGGVVLEQRRPEELASRLTALWTDPPRYDRMSRAAIESVARYSLEHWRDTIGDCLVAAWKPSGSVPVRESSS